MQAAAQRFPELPIVVGYWGRVRDFDRLLVRFRAASGGLPHDHSPTDGQSGPALTAPAGSSAANDTHHDPLHRVPDGDGGRRPLAVVVLGLNAWLSYDNTRRLADNDWSVAHTEQVMAVLSDVLVGAHRRRGGTARLPSDRGKIYLWGPTRRRRSRVGRQISLAKEMTVDNPRSRSGSSRPQPNRRRTIALLGDHLSTHRTGGPIRPELVQQEKKHSMKFAHRRRDARRRRTAVADPARSRRLASYFWAVVTLAVATVMAAVVVLAYGLLLSNLNARQRRPRFKNGSPPPIVSCWNRPVRAFTGLDLEGRLHVPQPRRRATHVESNHGGRSWGSRCTP